MALVVVGKQDQFRDEKRVVEPDPEHYADAQPAHGVHHEVQAKLHGCRETCVVTRAHTHTGMSTDVNLQLTLADKRQEVLTKPSIYSPA